MDDLRERLLGRDYLYVDASAYRAGVEAAFAAFETTMHAGATTQPIGVDPQVHEAADPWASEATPAAVGHA